MGTGRLETPKTRSGFITSINTNSNLDGSTLWAHVVISTSHQHCYNVMVFYQYWYVADIIMCSYDISMNFI